MAIPLLDDLDLCGKDLTADALLTQRKLADYFVRAGKARYHFTVKANQPSLLDDLVLFFERSKLSRGIDPRDHWSYRFPQDSLLPEFYWAFAQSEKYWEQARNLATGGGQPQFNGNALRDKPCPIATNQGFKNVK